MLPVGVVTIPLTFDRPVDHRGSTLWLVSSNGQERRIAARLEAEPSTLYAIVGRLRPGRYELHWTVRSLNGATLSGILPFGVWNTMRISEQRHR
jgi:methionine-rich copper-binding protein CopC